MGLIKLVGSAPLGCVRGEDQLITPRLQRGLEEQNRHTVFTVNMLAEVY